MKKKAEMGIGTLIIFIAMILVAAIAAGVLIQTASSLQNKALLTGSRSTSHVSTSVRPTIIYAEDGTTNQSVDRFFIKLKLVPGSDAIKISETLIEFSLSDASSDLIYNSTADCDVNFPEDGEGYAVHALIEGINNVDGYLQRGDVIEVCFTTPRSVKEDESISISIVPKIGSPTIILTALNDVITEKRIVVFP